MDKEKIVLALLEKMNNDTRSAGLQNGIDLMQIEQQIIANAAVNKGQNSISSVL